MSKCFYGYGVVDKNGKALCSSFQDKRIAEEIISKWNSDELDADAPHRIVPLFYEDSES